MKRLLLITLFLLSSAPAYAEWVKIITTKDATRYVDPTTIHRKGDFVKVWQLADFKTIQTYKDSSFWSFKIQTEHDCAEDRTKILAMTWFSGNMGTGKMIFTFSEEDGKWEPIDPQSAGQLVEKLVCSKK